MAVATATDVSWLVARFRFVVIPWNLPMSGVARQCILNDLLTDVELEGL